MARRTTTRTRWATPWHRRPPNAGSDLTLLDTCYLAADVDGRPVAGVQRRFSDGTVQAWAERVARLRAGPGLRIGVAVHSVRAVPRTALATVADEPSLPVRINLP